MSYAKHTQNVWMAIPVDLLARVDAHIGSLPYKCSRTKWIVNVLLNYFKDIDSNPDKHALLIPEEISEPQPQEISKIHNQDLEELKDRVSALEQQVEIMHHALRKFNERNH